MNNYEEGGLKLPHIESYCYALKMFWIQKLLNPMNHSQWKPLITVILPTYDNSLWIHEFNTDLTFFNFVWKLLITLFGQPRSNSIPKTLNFPE
jgi:hypothetical protein